MNARTGRPGLDRFGFGQAHGDYAVAGVGGALSQVGRRMLTALCLVVLVLLVVKKPPSAVTKGTITLAVLLVAFGITRIWGSLSARFGLRRCYLFTGGLVVTGMFGGARAVPWSEVTTLKMMSSQQLLMSFYRFEVGRRGGAPLAFLAMGMKPALVDQLVGRAAANGIVR
ncbi:hypothetical protein [Streptomyces sp. ITFR-16]|uniref:hypothetical protein n=1 Tax=Streptomyces sp. ITFR-16 TaxID=3075198 RepID=UPI00288A614B|nr:hypothetical protein [Streptomyces sp. ITFR-16]WNI20605.1 hypothetical protein RLT58_01150 [Streptomyces sp. ITFR-16]